MSLTAKYLHELLVNLKENGQEINRTARYRGGICSHLDDLIAVKHSHRSDLSTSLRQLFSTIMESDATEWPRHTGLSCYPVPYEDANELKKFWEDCSSGSRFIYFDTLSDEEDDAEEIKFENLTAAGKAELAFDHADKDHFWDANHPDGQARLEFLDFLIECVKKRI